MDEVEDPVVHRLVVPDDALALVTRGAFVRLALPFPVDVRGPDGDDSIAQSVFVGRSRGTFRAYLNFCRHQPVSLDYGMDAEDGSPFPVAPVTDDRRHLVCLRHGALFRLVDGLCESGPCEGQSLVALDVEDGPPPTVLFRRRHPLSPPFASE
ncbi:MAG: Rieske 2Fe-2S domain-containing protein [Polyangiaceae bacterium]